MKKQLIITTVFLLSAVHLWGMDEQSKVTITNPVEVVTHLVLQFFESNQTNDNKLSILKTIKNNFKTDGLLNRDINFFLNVDTNDERIAHNIDNARNVFSLILYTYYAGKKDLFISYFNEHGNKVCQVLIICFNEEKYLANEPYRIFLLTMLTILINYINATMSDNSAKENAFKIVNIIGMYIQNGGPSDDLNISFEACKSYVEHICGYLKSPSQLIKDFNQAVIKYCNKNTSGDEKKQILMWIRSILPLMISEETEETEAIEIINNFFNQEDYFSEVNQKDTQNILSVYTVIYLVYLKEYPEEICNTLLCYFDKTVIGDIGNYDTRIVTGLILMFLKSYVAGEFACYPSFKQESDKDILIQGITNIINYVKFFNIEDVDHFDSYKAQVINICKLLDSQEVVVKSMPVSLKSVPVTSSVDIKDIQSNEPTAMSFQAQAAFLNKMKNLSKERNLPDLDPENILKFDQENALQQEQKQNIPAEINSEKTTWQSIKSWFLQANDAIESLAQKAWHTIKSYIGY